MTSPPAGSPAFGRRADPPSDGATPAPTPAELSARAQAFRTELAAERPEPDGFAAWSRKQRARRAAAWIVSAGLMVPGLVCFGMDAPASVSLVVEVLGVVAGFWLRAERRRHLKAIAAWGREDGR